jgi:hypothetical protein
MYAVGSAATAWTWGALDILQADTSRQRRISMCFIRVIVLAAEASQGGTAISFLSNICSNYTALPAAFPNQQIFHGIFQVAKLKLKAQF